MFRIERLKRPLTDADPIPQDYLPGTYALREDAIEVIEALISAYQQHGYDAKQDYWWARDTGEIENNIFVVRAF
ncbi:hypothetical protein EN844_24630 [Mesorhizobium sp. M3A.F.Ca.ET.201.01.1.1]|uniref:hypothetical protein n=1 Tax=Mesorhizobium sp. M3A.F.Ca.ET.201.01.1.1 TaxID=2563946 RepID=UPI001093C9DF|nr:hypothetical protein [Mesorhizobium sp. M3A.F.Ca.ET.201.01.1.1]TGS63020.1 hypothetical protein EN844_24630 [Mesorhizobium sp. M3A.F.Ca.ET.201.01.1.1]